MATTFAPSLSTSTMRAPYSSAPNPSMADSLPNINFGFDDLRDRMAKFTYRFDDFIAQGRKRVLEERNQFRTNLAELQASQQIRKHDIEILAHKSTTHAHTVAREAAESAEMSSAIADLTSQRDARAAQRDALRAEIAAHKKLIAQRLAAQRQHAAYLDAQQRHNGPELAFWEEYLGLRIEGAGQVDRLRFVFSALDERDWDREAWFELDTEEREYKVEGVLPKVEGGRVEACVDRLNENRDLGGFLRGMRDVLAEAVR